MEMKKELREIELLAPAKNAEVGRAAIDAGADAVYIGGPSFGARKAAGNSLCDIEGLCRYAHFFRAKVLVTLNTLLRDDEYPEAVRLAYAYRQIGVDAIIIQDLRLAEMLFRTGDFSGENGGIRLHASTQCDNRTVERVRELQEMGFKRVVLARELSLEEIRQIRKQTTVELETFVHGALCVSYSGACYMSEQVCGRSANRGECAQMCRLQYDVLDENRQELLRQKHILSLRDLDRSHILRELLLTGATTLKIEGRLKEADYVRNVVAYYRALLDQLANEELGNWKIGASSAGICRRSFTPNPEKTFHRGGTTYFSTGRPASLVNQDTPKSTGEYIGTAPLPQGLTRGVTLSNGDGLCFGCDGFYWPNSRIRIPAGTPVYRNLDVSFQRQLEAKDATLRVLPVRILFEEAPDGFRLTAEGDATRVTLHLPAEKTPAQNAERAEAVVRQQLQKLGGTRLEATEVSVRWSEPCFLPASVLNDWRRQLAERFTEARENSVRPAERKASDSDIRSLIELVLSEREAPLPASDHDAMTCKYCILHELGCCKTRQPRKSGIPTYLRQGDRLFLIETHCRECYMTLRAL